MGLVCEMVDYPSTQKKGFKGAWLEFEINVSWCFCFDTFLNIQKHRNTNDAYLNNKHFSIILTCFEQQLGKKLLYEITIKS